MRTQVFANQCIDCTVVLFAHTSVIWPMSPARDLAIYDSQLYENVVFYILPHRGAEILQRNPRAKREPYDSPAFFGLA
jgi:hypothetical protein